MRRIKFGSCVNPCNAIGVRAETTDPGTPVVVVLRHSELRDDHQNLTIGDAAKWAAKKVSSGDAPPIRYPRTYEKVFEALPGYRFIDNPFGSRLSPMS